MTDMINIGAMVDSWRATPGAIIHPKLSDAVDAARAAFKANKMTGFQSKRKASKSLLEPQAEPVAWRRYNRSIGWQYEDGVTSFASDPSAEPLYAAPQAAVAEPLKDWEFVAMWATAAETHADKYDTAVEFGRAVESRHGIKGSAA